MQLGVLFGGQLLGGGIFGRLALFGASSAASALLGKKKDPVGKLNDLRVSSASYGRGIPIVWGTIRVTGNIFWSTDFREEKVILNSKGKPKSGKMAEKKVEKGKAQEYYRYYANYAVALCEGPVDGIIRIWADNNLIYNKLNPSDPDIVEIGFSQGDSGSGRKDSGLVGGKKGRHGHSGRFRFRAYPGTETQMPDPFMLSKTGADRSPGYRGLCYLFFEDFSLEDFGNRIPTITVEVTRNEIRRPMVSPMTNLEDIWYNTAYGHGNFDNIRNRMYIPSAADTSGTLEDRYRIRVYDFMAQKELYRISKADITKTMPQYVWNTNGTDMRLISPSQLEMVDLLGLSHRGDLIFRCGNYSRYNPILLIDPDTYVIKQVMETGGPVIQAYPTLVFDSINGWIPATVLVPQYGRVTILKDAVAPDHDPDTISKNPYKRLASVGGVNFTYFDIGPIVPGFYNNLSGIYIMSTRGLWQYEGGYLRFAPLTYFMDNSYEAANDGAYGNVPVQAEVVTRWPDRDVPNRCRPHIHWIGFHIPTESVIFVAEILEQYNDMKPGYYACKLDKNGEISWQEYMEGVDQAPSSYFQTPNIIDGHELSYITWGLGDQWLITINWTEETLESHEVSGFIPSHREGDYYWSERDAIVYEAGNSYAGDDDTRWVTVYINRVVQGEVSVAEICRDIAERCRIPRQKIDVSGLDGIDTVTGYMIESPTEARDTLQELATAFQFDAVESDYTLKFILRGTSAKVVIPQEDLGVVDTDFETENEYYVETRMQEVDLPERVTLSFIDPENDYETMSAHFKRPTSPIPVVGSREHLEMTMSMATKHKIAKTLAQRILYAAWNERTTHNYVYPPDYLKYDPSDVVRVLLENGEMFEDRLTEMTVGADWRIEVSSVSQYANAFQFDEPNPDSVSEDGDSVYNLQTVVEKLGGVIPDTRPHAPNVTPEIFDLPYLSDEDASDASNQFTYYWGIRAYGEGFRFGSLFSKHGTDDLEQEGAAAYALTWGSTLDAVPSPPDGPDFTDLTTKITLKPGFQYDVTTPTYEWASIPDEEWPSTTNMIIIGGEVILFKDVEVLEDGDIVISTLLRGRRGTINAAYTHQTRELWAVVTDPSVLSAAASFDDVGRILEYIATSAGAIMLLPDKHYAVLTAASMRPYPVGAVNRTDNSSGSTTINWKRSTRYNGGLKAGTSTVPLNEIDERYELFVLKDPYDPNTWDPEDPDMYLLHVDELTSPSYTITTGDFTTMSMDQTDQINVVIYQLSGIVDRGFPRGVTLDYAKFAF